MKKVIIGVVTSGVFAFELVPHLFPHYIASSFMLDSKKVEAETLESVKTICRKLDIDESHKIKVTVGEGFVGGNLGSRWLPNGAILSLPLTMYFSSKKDIKSSNIISKRYLSKHPNLADKLIPSSDSNKFQIARELVHLKSNDYLLSSAILPTFYLIALGGFALFNRWKFQRRSLLVLNKSLVAIGAICAYHIVTTRVTNWQVYRADKIAASIDPTFMSGAIEFMKMNQLWEKAFADDAIPETSIMGLMAYLWFPTAQQRLKRLLDMQIGSSSHWK